MVYLKSGLICLSCLLLHVSCNVLNDDETRDRIDSFVERVMQCDDIPGVSLGVIRDGQVSKDKGKGLHICSAVFLLV